MAGLDLLARKSLERGSEVSILISESVRLKASAKDQSDEDDGWSWRKLRDVFAVKNAEFLFTKYQSRLQHTLYMLAVMVNIVCCLSALLIIWVNSQDPSSDEVVLGIRGGCLCVSLVIYVVSYQESWFLRKWSRLLESVVLILIICVQEMATSVQVLIVGEISRVRFSALPILVSSVFLPFPRWYQVFLSTAGVISAELIISGLSYRNSAHLWSQMGADFTYHVGLALIGLYIRFLMEFTNRKAFLDRREYFESRFHLQYAKEQEERLLLSVLPKHIASQVRDSIRDIMKKHENSHVPQRPFTELFVEKHRNVSILYADIVNSVELTSSLHVSDLVEALNDLFGRFDECAERNFCLRIKLLGDCYQCVSGVPDRDPLHADHCVQMGLDMIDVIRSFREESRVNVDMRIGVHSGNVLSGLLGLRKWQFDIWSRDVTIASRVEQSGKPGCVHVTKATRDLLQGRYCIEPLNGNFRDEYLQKYNMDTFLIHPASRSQFKRDSLYERVRLGSNGRQQSAQGNRLQRRQSIVGEVLSSRRRTVLGFSLLQFRQMVSQVNHFMDSAIDVMSLSKKDQWFNSEGIQPLFLTFRDRRLEKPFLQQQDPLFKFSLLSTLFAAIVLLVTSSLTKPQIPYMWLACFAVILVALISIFSFWIRFLWKKFKKDSDLDLLRGFQPTVTSVAVRIIVFIVLFVLLMAAALIGMDGCPEAMVESNNSSTSSNVTSRESRLPAACQDPWYFTRWAILVMTSASVFLRIHFLLKLLIAGSSLAAYASLDLRSPPIFSKPYLQDWAQVPAGFDQCWSLAIIWFLLHLLDRQVEYIGRLDYLWERKLKSEQEEASFVGFVNQTLLTNILPVHVAHYYLSKESVHLDLDLYHEQYSAVAVMFATIPNYMDFYTESLLNDEGRKCLQVLHEIICDFDKLLYDRPFLKLEKIKTIGSTYMVAAGLQPGRNSSRTSNESFGPEENATQNVLTLTKFAFAMMDTLEELNKNSFQDFKLRIGISVGPVVAGVVGVSKPQYDIWGDTVNLASRMDSTGITGTIQVTESVATILRENSKFHCICRGQVFVKGKGLMTTYLIHRPQEVTRL